MLQPLALAFRDHTGPIILEFPPFARSLQLEPAAFVDRLDRFLGALPGDFEYAVELRDRRLLTKEYHSALRAHGVAHTYNYWSAMPMPADQASVAPPEDLPFTIVRLLLKPGTWYEDQREIFRPFNRIVQPDETMRRQVVDLAHRSLKRQKRVYVLVNNKAEGSSPLTVIELAKRLLRKKSSRTGSETRIPDVTAVEDVLGDLRARGVQQLEIGRRLLLRVPLVARAPSEENRRQRRRAWLHVRRHIAGQHDQTITPAFGGGAIGHRHALRETDEHQRPARAVVAFDRADRRPHVRGVVGNLQLAILTRHPAADDLLMVAGVETMQRLHADEAPVVVRDRVRRIGPADGAEIRQHLLGVFAKSVEADQHRREARCVATVHQISPVRTGLESVDNHS